MFRILVYIFLAYLAYQFIFKFLVPVYRTTKQVRKSFRDMQNQMNGSANREPQTQQATAETPDGSGKEKVGEYIDFEEIK